MLRKHSWHDEGALVEKAGVKANVGRMARFRGGRRSEVRKKNEQRGDKGFLIEAVS